MIRKIAGLCAGWMMLAGMAVAQDNYEIQVYGSQTVSKGYTMVELHSNYTADGERAYKNAVLPTQHMLHETVEITHGFTPWFEVGCYFFNTFADMHRTNYVGSHIRPRVRVPDSWKWPVGVSLSLEGGFQKRAYSEDDWSMEIRPIVDKQLANWYLSFNPTFDKSFHGLNKNQGFEFAPNFKAGYSITKTIAPGIEYYGGWGALNNLPPFYQQEHQLFAVVDLNVSPVWEINAGFGWGLTGGTDDHIFKLILGRRFH